MAESNQQETGSVISRLIFEGFVIKTWYIWYRTSEMHMITH